LLAHQPLQQLDRLERADHHLEALYQATIVAEGDDIDSIDFDPFDLGLKLENRARVVAPLLGEPELGAAQRFSST
jgi:hypothetical protein